jgi:hypothetical protein
LRDSSLSIVCLPAAYAPNLVVRSIGLGAVCHR